MNIPKKTTYSQLWQGDFDRDGVPNMDDVKPFDKGVKRRVNKEVSLSNAYSNLKLRRKKYQKTTDELSKLIGAKDSRVKTVYSAIGKQMGRNIIHVEDMGGLRVLTNSRKESKQKVNLIKRTFPKCRMKKQKNCIKEIDNKYSSLKNKNQLPYLGYHVNLRYKGEPHEIQIKCNQMQKIQDKAHPLYKKGEYSEMNRRFRPSVMRIYKKGC